MASKIWNYLLLILVLTLSGAIIRHEISYDRFSRFEYNVRYSGKDGTFIKLTDNHFYAKEDTFSVPDGESSVQVQKMPVPEKILLAWFSYNDNAFYEFDGSIAPVTRTLGNKDDLMIEFGEKGTFSVTLSGEGWSADDKAAGSYRGKKVLRSWPHADPRREKAVFFIRNKKEVTSYLFLESGSELSEIRFDPVTDLYFPSSEDYADSLSNGVLLHDARPAIIRLPSRFTLKFFRNAGMKPGSEEDLFAPLMEMMVSFDDDQLYRILKSDPEEKRFDLKINLDKDDNLKSVYLSAHNKVHRLKTSIVYARRSSG